MKILSWNIRQGGGSRVLMILDVLNAENPDIIALNEWQNNKSGLQLQMGLLRLGYIYQVVPAAKPNINSAFIASRYPCSSTIYNNIDDEYSANVVTAKYEAFDLHSVYFPHKKKHRLLDFFLQLESESKPQIIVGDYNTGINGVDQKGDSFWYESDFKALLSKGYVDAFRHVNGAILEYSWYSHQSNGYRYDHTLVSSDIVPLVGNCSYLHQYREAKISDHSPMLLFLQTD